MPFSPSSNSPKRGCVAATAIIWGCSTGMLAIVLLSKAAQSETMISIAIVFAAAISTMAVWLSTSKTAARNAEESDQTSDLIS